MTTTTHTSTVTHKRQLESLLSALEAERPTTELLRLTAEDVWELGTWLRAVARERRLAVEIDIRRGEQVLFHVAMPGTTPDHGAWAERKARLVRRFEAPSYLVGTRMVLKGQDLAHYGLSRADYAELGGCVPLCVKGVGMVGTLALSGLAQAEDHALAVEALRECRRRQLADLSEGAGRSEGASGGAGA